MKNYNNFYFFGNSFSHKGTWASILANHHEKNNAEYPTVGGKYNLLQQLEGHLSSHAIDPNSVYFYYAGGYDARDGFVGAYLAFSMFYEESIHGNGGEKPTEHQLCKSFTEMLVQCIGKGSTLCHSLDNITDPITKSMLAVLGNDIGAFFFIPVGDDIQGLFFKIVEIQEFAQKLIAEGAKNIVIVNQIKLGYIDYDNYQITSSCDIRPESESINTLWNMGLDKIKRDNGGITIVNWHDEFEGLLQVHTLAEMIQGNHLSPLANQYLAEQVAEVL